MNQSRGSALHYVECATCSNYSKFYCNNCHQRMCKQCRNVHLQEKGSRKHEVVLYQDKLKELPPEKCPVHPTKTLELYCDDCPKSVCSKCFATDHNGHKVLDLEVVYNKSLQQCQEELIKIRDSILPQSKGKVKSQKEEVENVKKEISKLRLSMKKSAEEIKAAVDTILADNNSKLDIMEASILGEMAKQEKKSGDYISYLDNLIKDLNSDMSSWRPSELITFTKEKANISLKKFPDIMKPGIPEFTKGTIENKEIEKLFGCINPCKERKMIKEVKKIQESPQPGMELSSSVDKVHEVNIPGLKEINNVSPLPSGNFWASDYDGTLIQSDRHGNIHHKMYTGRREGGFHTVTEEEDLLYTDCEKKTIFKVSSDMNPTAILDTEEWTPMSICSSHINGDILVGMKKDRKWKVTRYNKRGMKLQDIWENDEGYDLYTGVNFITENTNGDICTTDNRKVMVLTSSGEHRFSYAGSFRSRFHPYEICTDVLGNILVYNGYRSYDEFVFDKYAMPFPSSNEFGIHLLDKDGQFLSLLLESQSSFSLHAFCVDYQHNLLVGRGCTITVYKYIQMKSTS